MWFPFVFHGTLSAVPLPDSETLLSLPNGFFVTVPAQENSHCFLKLGGEELECYYENFSCQTCLATLVRKEGRRSLWNNKLSQTSYVLFSKVLRTFGNRNSQMS